MMIMGRTSIEHDGKRYAATYELDEGAQRGAQLAGKMVVQAPAAVVQSLMAPTPESEKLVVTLQDGRRFAFLALMTEGPDVLHVWGRLLA
jgi:hypothetical protein